MSTHTSDCVEILVIKSLCKRIRSDYSKSVLNSVVSSYFAEDLPELDPETYSCANDFKVDYGIYSLLKKWKGWNTRIKPKNRAFAAWLAAEQKCFKTNERISRPDQPLAALKLISEVQRKIIEVIGNAPPSDIFSECRWGNGATSSLRRSEASIAQKQTSVLSITPRAERHFAKVIKDDLWETVLPGYSYARGNRGVMVPKTAKTDRPIAAEPSGNSFLQQGIGRYLRICLKKSGVDLNLQSVNQNLAFAALVDGLATIDLSSASDTLALEVVRLLLPPAWFDLLFDIRSPCTTWDGKTFHLSKFSSMGNAFTFELESLIFWAISKVTVNMTVKADSIKTVSVYGDDIIVPQACSVAVINSLEYFGFIVNWDKSYLSGSFYESCGRQYFDLEDVTPPYQKEVVGTSLYELVRLHNRLFRWGMRIGMKYVLDALVIVKKFTKLHHPKLKFLPSIPVGSVSDQGFLSYDLKPNVNGDYTCNLLLEDPRIAYLISDKEQIGLYAYKLRMSRDFRNGSPDGLPAEVFETATRLRKGRVWASSLTET